MWIALTVIIQQPIRKAVGRPLTPRKRLLAVEHLGRFFRKHAPGLYARTNQVDLAKLGVSFDARFIAIPRNCPALRG